MPLPRSVFLLSAILLSLSGAPARGETLLIEAEQFDRLGGWVNDAQFMDRMGSPFLLAHGLGVPVEDAVTTVSVPAAGTWRVWVRTRDWVATWNAPGAPGRFRVLLNGQALAATFGTESAEWHWQDGGTVQITDASKPLELRLHDLTGFEGRCDAVVLTTDPGLAPPNGDPEMTAWRRKLLGISDRPADGAEYDLVVVGGGIAGTCASLSAARLGLKVALVQDRPVLGGNNSSEVRVWLQGARNKEPFPRVGDVVAELEQERHAHYGPSNTADLYEDGKKLDLVREEKNIDLYTNHRANAVETADGRLQAVVAQHTTSGCRVRLGSRWFADCTGDGCLGMLAGADYDITLQGHMGRCNLWNVIDTGKPSPFPRCPWALDLSDMPFPGRAKAVAGAGPDRRGIEALGGWYWESGFDHDPLAKGEAIRDWNFRAMYGAWDALKNVDGRYETYRLNWAAFVSGKRESRRLLGDVVLTKEDVLSANEYPDGCVPTGWPIDLHLPDPRYEKGFEGDAFIAQAHYDRYPPPYWIPYRCLYSRNVPNLFMAGRDISVTHEALGTVRVMRTGGCMGEIVGMAASLCKRYDAGPREIYSDHFDELRELMRCGVGKAPAPPMGLKPPAWLASAGENLARAAAIRVSGSRDAEASPPALLNDGRADLNDNASRWLSDAKLPHWVEFRWEKPQSLGAARILSGYRTAGGSVTGPLRAFCLEWHDGHQWQAIHETVTADNSAADWHRRFPPVTTNCLRLLVAETQIDISRVWEVELYGEVPD